MVSVVVYQHWISQKTSTELTALRTGLTHACLTSAVIQMTWLMSLERHLLVTTTITGLCLFDSIRTGVFVRVNSHC